MFMFDYLKDCRNKIKMNHYNGRLWGKKKLSENPVVFSGKPTKMLSKSNK